MSAVWPPRVAGRVAVAALAAGLLALAGCAGVPQWERPGARRAEVLARLGPPTAVHPLPDGERLQYSQQPAGVRVDNLDFDRDGRLVRQENALTPAAIARIEPGRWSREDVLRLLGRPAQVERVALFNGDIWTYRYQEPGLVYRRLHVHLDPAGRVVQVLSTDEDTPDDRAP